METCKSSGLLAASAQVISRPVAIHGITLLQASAACTLIIYDSATGAAIAGAELDQLNNNTNTSTVTTNYNKPVECLNGLWAAVTGTGAKYIVRYSLL